MFDFFQVPFFSLFYRRGLDFFYMKFENINTYLIKMLCIVTFEVPDIFSSVFEWIRDIRVHDIRIFDEVHVPVINTDTILSLYVVLPFL